MTTNYERYFSSPELCALSFARHSSCPIGFTAIIRCGDCKHHDECSGTTPYSTLRQWFSEWLEEEVSDE